MEAKDTVIDSDAQCDMLDAVFERLPNLTVTKQNTLIRLVEQVAEAQAEISFRAGMKDVVEWIKEQQYKCKNPKDMAYHWLLIPPDDWSAQMKEWGIK